MTIEPCVKTPPTSVIDPRAWENSGVHAGVVVGHTGIVPGSIREKSSGRRMTLAGAPTLDLDGPDISVRVCFGAPCPGRFMEQAQFRIAGTSLRSWFR